MNERITESVEAAAALAWLEALGHQVAARPWAGWLLTHSPVTR